MQEFILLLLVMTQLLKLLKAKRYFVKSNRINCKFQCVESLLGFPNVDADPVR